MYNNSESYNYNSHDASPQQRHCSSQCYTFSYFDSRLMSSSFSFNISLYFSRNSSFSLSRNEALIAIWFSLTRRASLDRFAATLFFLRRCQYLSSLAVSSTNIYKQQWYHNMNNINIIVVSICIQHIYKYFSTIRAQIPVFHPLLT